MTVSVEWSTRIVTIPQAEMPIVQTVPSEIRELDLTELRYALHVQQESTEGIGNPDIHRHIEEYETGGVLYAQAVNFINNYYIQLEPGLYNVRVVGGNTNLSDVEIKTSVGVSTSNSAGLQTVDTGGAGDCPTVIEIADEVESRTLDANIIAVTDTSVTDIDDFKADTVTVDISGIPQAVWEYATRTITTTAFDTNIITVNGNPVTSVDDFKADVSNLSADVNVVEVNGVVVNSIEDFKAAEFDGDVNVVSVAGSGVSGVDDFKADISGIDLSGVPASVWGYMSRTLTSEEGMTTAQEAKLDAVLQALADLDNSIFDANLVSVEDDDLIANPVWNKVIP